MSKIEDMAAKYSSKIYKEIQGDIPYTDLSGYKRGMLDAIDPYVEDAYIAGANAVLKEIENLLPEGDSRIYNDAGNALIWRLRKRIEELKGK